MAVLSDVIRADEKGAKHRDAHIIVTEEIHELAMNLLYLRTMQLQYRTLAKDLHEKDLAEQNKHDIQDELEYSHEKHTAAQRMIHKKMMSFRRSASLDKSRVSQDWKVGRTFRCPPARSLTPPPAPVPERYKLDYHSHSPDWLRRTTCPATQP